MNVAQNIVFKLRSSRRRSSTLKHFVYIVECIDRSLYTGCSWNPELRVNEHNTSKRGAKSLRGKLPVKLVYSEVYDSINKALRREREIKGWSRKRKLALINGNSALALMSPALRDEEAGVVQ